MVELISVMKELLENNFFLTSISWQQATEKQTQFECLTHAAYRANTCNYACSIFCPYLLFLLLSRTFTIHVCSANEQQHRRRVVKVPQTLLLLANYFTLFYFSAPVEKRSNVTSTSVCVSVHVYTHCKNIGIYMYIHGYFVASFPYFNGTGSVCVCTLYP